MRHLNGLTGTAIIYVTDKCHYWLPFMEMLFNYGVVIITVSGELWKSSGRRSCHSKEEAWCVAEIVLRCLVSASHRIKINIRSATKEIIDPIEEITFHFVIASG